ncbi:MAG TPA: serine/threonine-protein kinase [Pirellulales bacterium]|nr:serine/threonine-protein kinase [Pirellulales bacterium]
MVSPRFHCDQNRLRLALADELGEDAQEALVTHLEHCDDCRTQLEALAAGRDWWRKAQSHLSEDPRDAGTAATARSDQPWLGFLVPGDDNRYLGSLGPYQVTEVIGCGGFGVVLKAFDPALNRHVAIKVLSPQLANSGAARRRFAREAQAAAAVVNEHVVAIHAVAENDGLPYLVMSHIPGCSLQDRLDRQGPLELKEILRIGMQVAAGLSAAHAQGLVHRDIKPGNILLEHGVERVKITDFGLARTIDDASLTASGVIAGTPQYMAPEQARGEAVDHRSDLFSLGSVLYATCTGHSPFRAETFMASWRRLCMDTPRPIRETNPEVPDWLAEIIEKLHAKQPRDRFQSAEEVCDLLARHLAHLQQPTVAPRPPRLRSNRFGLRGRTRGAVWLAAAGIVCLAMVAWRWSLAEREPQDAGRAAEASGERSAEAVAPDAHRREWPEELAETEFDIQRLESQLQRPASRLPPDEREGISEIESELQALERQMESGR